MNRYLARIVAIVLVPCLPNGPVLAALNFQSKIENAKPGIVWFCFAQEALAPAAANEVDALSAAGPQVKKMEGRRLRRSRMTRVSRLRGLRSWVLGASLALDGAIVPPAQSQPAARPLPSVIRGEVSEDSGFSVYEKEINEASIWLADQYMPLFHQALTEPRMYIRIGRSRDLSNLRQQAISHLPEDAREPDDPTSPNQNRKPELFVTELMTDGRYRATIWVNPAVYQDPVSSLSAISVGLAEAASFFHRLDGIIAGGKPAYALLWKNEVHDREVRMLKTAMHGLKANDRRLLDLRSDVAIHIQSWLVYPPPRSHGSRQTSVLAELLIVEEKIAADLRKQIKKASRGGGNAGAKGGGPALFRRSS